jgi:hypothetical protein
MIDASSSQAIKPLSAESSDPAMPRRWDVARNKPRRKTWFDKVEAFISALSVRDNFWHRICSFIWLPYAFFSGIRMKRIDAMTFSAVLPFKRFNRNWYRAMAGAALLGNTEIAGGMYVFGICGAGYTVVCKHLDYRFMRPCYGPAVYKMKPREDIHVLLASGQEFNLTLEMDILQQMSKGAAGDRRVGRAVVTFHVTPKDHHQARIARVAERARQD